ncbi:3-(3-hydroxy-phenyl)propionate transporter MhpT [Falsirhodobacter deserti]|uniref:3-(3-hydroxy-phenyl)propionate transporter MhpT n=1 Tax=Falsirhodobacter deserti TaxID=1365611 RepID=UPI000FE41E6D|nr:3-(3-hydroxy-phenyl)propionate transporter MhpT [Falsirhodobacter deserti]
MGRVSTASGGSRAIAICFVAALIEGFDIQVAGIAAPRLGPDLGLSPSQMGMFFSAATFGLMFGALAGGWLSDRHGRRMALALSLAVFGVFSIATALASSYEMLIALRFLTGVGLGGALPNLVAIAAESAEPEKRGRAVALMYAGIPLGGAIVSLISIAGLGDGWRMLFVIGGVLPLLIIPLVLQLPPLRVTAAHGSGGIAAVLGHGRAVPTVLLWAGFFFSLLVLYLLLNWLPALMVSRGFDRSEAGFVQLVFNLGGAAGSLVGGVALDARNRPLWIAASFGGLVAALALLAAAPANILVTLVVGTVLGVAVIAVQAILYGIAPQCYPAEARGKGVGLAVAVGRFGSVAGPLLAGVLVASGQDATGVLVNILPVAILGGAATWLLARRRRTAQTA